MSSQAHCRRDKKKREIGQLLYGASWVVYSVAVPRTLLTLSSGVDTSYERRSTAPLQQTADCTESNTHTHTHGRPTACLPLPAAARLNVDQQQRSVVKQTVDHSLSSSTIASQSFHFTPTTVAVKWNLLSNSHYGFPVWLFRRKRLFIFTLRASCGAVYCNRSCLWVWVCVCVSVWVGLLPR